MQSKLKMVIEYLNPAVQYVLMCDFCCFFNLLSPLVSLFSDCYGGWQMCPVAIFVGTIYFKTHICPGLCMSASCLWWIHPVTRASLPLTSPSQEMTAKNNPPQSLFCSTHPYWHNIIVFVFEVHRMRRTHLAMMTGGKNNLSRNNYVTLHVVECF